MNHRQILHAMMAATALSMASPLPAVSQGIPVIDNTAILKQIQQIAELQKQLEQAKAIYDKATELHDSFNQLTDMGDIASLLNDREFTQMLPAEYKQYASAVDGLLKGNIDGFASQYDYYETQNSPANDFYNQELKRQKGETYQDMAVGQAVYDAASKRFEALDELKKEISRAETPKQALDLQARIQAESAILQNEVLRMQGVAMIQEARNRVDEQREKESIQKMYDDMDAAIRSGG